MGGASVMLEQVRHDSRLASSSLLLGKARKRSLLSLNRKVVNLDFELFCPAAKRAKNKNPNRSRRKNRIFRPRTAQEGGARRSVTEIWEKTKNSQFFFVFLRQLENNELECRSCMTR
jgi:hypothetical protein